MPPKEDKAAALLRIRERPQAVILKSHALGILAFISFTAPTTKNAADAGNTVLFQGVETTGPTKN